MIGTIAEVPFWCSWKHRVPLLQIQQPGAAVVHILPLHCGLLRVPPCRLHLQVSAPPIFFPGKSEGSAIRHPMMQRNCPACRRYGRKRTMLLAGILFDIGVVLTAAAFNLAMLLAGRILLGIAVAFASVAVTLYNSEMAPAHIRGRLNQIFQAWHVPPPPLAAPAHARCVIPAHCGSF